MGIRQFQVAGGTIVGRDHRVVYKNNQDAYAITEYEGLTVAVVADGCGSGVKSEVGAHLGVRLVTEQIARMYAVRRTLDWPRLERHIVSQLDTLAQSLGGNYRQAVEDYLLFTLVGVVIAGDTVTFFACGDGIVRINDQALALGPYSGNMPPYIAYRLLESELKIDPREVRLAPIAVRPSQLVESFLLGTDGVEDIVLHADRTMPGIEKPMGDLCQFWTDDRYFRGNPDLVSRQLRLMGRDYPVANPEHGLLHDDTTLIVGRKNPEYKEE